MEMNGFVFRLQTFWNGAIVDIFFSHSLSLSLNLSQGNTKTSSDVTKAINVSSCDVKEVSVLYENATKE